MLYLSSYFFDLSGLLWTAKQPSLKKLEKASKSFKKLQKAWKSFKKLEKAWKSLAVFNVITGPLSKVTGSDGIVWSYIKDFVYAVYAVYAVDALGQLHGYVATPIIGD